MAWTTPRTWVAGELVTAGMMNQHIRDNSNAIFAASLGLAWVRVLPVWTGTTTNPAQGNGTLWLDYACINKMCFAHMYLYVGSTTTFGSGLWEFSLPFDLGGVGEFIGTGYSFDLSATFWYSASRSIPTNPHRFSLFYDGSNQILSPTVPFTFTTGDAVQMDFFYETV